MGGLLMPCVALAWGFLGTVQSGDAGAAGWPQWLGPSRDGTAPGDAPSHWPERLALRWAAAADSGASSPVIAGGLVFVQGRSGKEETVVALDLDRGGETWRWSQPLTAKLPGEAVEHAPASTPAFQDGRLFVHSANNAVICLDGRTGRERWRRDLRAELGKGGPMYGPAASPLLADGAVVLPIGDRQGGAVMAFDASTGRTVWESGSAPPGYGSALAATLAGREQILVFGISQLLGLVKNGGAYDAAWEYPFRAGDGNQSTPAFLGRDTVVITHEQETHALRIRSAGGAWKPEVLWTSELNGNMATPHVHAGRVYLHSQNELHCLSGEDGRELSALELPGEYCSLVRLGAVLLCLSQEGTLAVVDVAGPRMRKLAEYKVVDGMTCSHLAVAGSNLIVRGRSGVRCTTWETGSDWAQWRGPARQGVSMEAGIPDAFPAGGLKLLWKADCRSEAWTEGGVANGITRNGSPAASDGRVYMNGVTGKILGQERLFCFDLKSGKPLWDYPLAESGLANCTPAIDPATGRLYVTSTGSPGIQQVHYQVVCLDAKSGRKIWSADEARLGLREGHADSGSPLLWGSLLITPHADQLLALDKATGNRVWSWPERLVFEEATPPEGTYRRVGGEAGKRFDEWYAKIDKRALRGVRASSSPILVEADKRPVIVQGVFRLADTGYCSSMAAVDAKTGKQLWLGPWIGSHHTPVFSDGLLVTSVDEGDADAGAYAQAIFMAAYRPRWTGDAFEFQEAWRSKQISGRYRLPSPVFVNKTVYWREDELLYSVDASTGAVRWKEMLFREKGAQWPITSPIWAGGKIFHVTERGMLRILRDRGGKVEVLLTQKVCCERGATNASPIVADGKLLLRDSEALYCYQLRP